MATDGVKRKLAAILSADAKDYSRLMRDDEAATVSTITAYRDVMTKLVRQHHGRVVDSPGDNLLAEFASVVDGVQAAVAIQDELKAMNAKQAPNRRMEFRIGINLGDIIEEENRIYGDGVNIAARIESLAEPGGICISRTAYDQIEDKLPLGYEYLGEKTVKNIPRPITVYRVVTESRRSWIGSKRRTRTSKGRSPAEAYTPSPPPSRAAIPSEKKRALVLILCGVFGIFGAHRFYIGKTFTAKLMLFSIGGLGIWYLTDLLVIIFGDFLDKEGRKITKWF